MTLNLSDRLVQAPPVKLEVKASASGQIEGYASTIGGAPDRHGEIVQPGAFAKSLARQNSNGEMRVMLWAHAQESPIGRWNRMHEDRKGLFVEGALNLNTTKGREAFEHVKGGDAGAHPPGSPFRTAGANTWAKASTA